MADATFMLDTLTTTIACAYANRTRLTNELAQCERDIRALELAVSHIERSVCGLPPLPAEEVLRAQNGNTIDGRMRAIHDRWSER